MKTFIGWSMLVLACSSFAMAGLNAPEIDAPSGTAALTLLSGGLLILRSRKKK